jgi:D-alanine-D-alanine ligase-like ATP-grasp enzyme
MKAIKKIIYTWISKKFMGGCSSYNSLETRKGCRSKEQARSVFKQGNVPHAQGAIFFNPWVAHKFAQQHGFPLVIKPNVSGFSRGSHFPINNYKELWQAIFLAKLWWPTTVVEQFLLGKNYRVVVIKGQIMSIIERYAPFVTGDGQLSISELIDQENIIRQQMALFPCIYPLNKSATTVNFLKKQRLTLDDVPDKGTIVNLFYRISLAPGGVVRTVDKQSIPAVNNQLFIDVLEMFDANILGIDVIFEQDITKDYHSQKCIFLEVNSRPYLKMHDYPRYGEKEDLSRYFKQLDQLDIAQSDIF